MKKNVQKKYENIEFEDGEFVIIFNHENYIKEIELPYFIFPEENYLEFKFESFIPILKRKADNNSFENIGFISTYSYPSKKPLYMIERKRNEEENEKPIEFSLRFIKKENEKCLIKFYNHFKSLNFLNLSLKTFKSEIIPNTNLNKEKFLSLSNSIKILSSQNQGNEEEDIIEILNDENENLHKEYPKYATNCMTRGEFYVSKNTFKNCDYKKIKCYNNNYLVTNFQIFYKSQLIIDSTVFYKNIPISLFEHIKFLNYDYKNNYKELSNFFTLPRLSFKENDEEILNNINGLLLFYKDSLLCSFKYNESKKMRRRRKKDLIVIENISNNIKKFYIFDINIEKKIKLIFKLNENPEKYEEEIKILFVNNKKSKNDRTKKKYLKYQKFIINFKDNIKDLIKRKNDVKIIHEIHNDFFTILIFKDRSFLFDNYLFFVDNDYDNSYSFKK